MIGDRDSLIFASSCTILFGMAASYFSGNDIVLGFFAGLTASVIGCTTIIIIDHMFPDSDDKTEDKKKLIVEDTNENTRR